MEVSTDDVGVYCGHDCKSAVAEADLAPHTARAASRPSLTFAGLISGL